MSAFDPTTQHDEVERRLRSWMADQHAGVDLTSTYARIVERTGSSTPRSRFLVRPALTRTDPPTAWAYRWGRTAPIVIAALLLGLAIGAGVLVGSRLERNEPVPSPVPSLPAVVLDPAIELESQSTLTADVRYTSSLFEPKVTFTASARSLGETASDICMPARTSQRTIVLAHPKSCIEDLRFIRPWAVACGSAGDHPDAAALADAILAIPGARSSIDLGDIQAGGDLPEGTFRDPYRGRVIRMPGAGPLVDPGSADPDHCLLLPEPGTDDPVIEIRHDIGAILVLLDIEGQLVVIRASGSGYDGATHAEAASRGYAAASDDQKLHLLRLVRDIRFGP